MFLFGYVAVAVFSSGLLFDSVGLMIILLLVVYLICFLRVYSL